MATTLPLKMAQNSELGKFSYLSERNIVDTTRYMNVDYGVRKVIEINEFSVCVKTMLR